MLILDLFLDLIVLWVGSVLSPETIMFTDTKAMIITTLILYAVNILLGLSYVLIVFITGLIASALTRIVPFIESMTTAFVVVCSLLFALFINYISLYLVNTYYDGLTITNTTHMVILSLVLAFTGVKTNKNN